MHFLVWFLPVSDVVSWRTRAVLHCFTLNCGQSLWVAKIGTLQIVGKTFFLFWITLLYASANKHPLSPVRSVVLSREMRRQSKRQFVDQMNVRRPKVMSISRTCAYKNGVCLLWL